jgi:chemotaxis protein CheX
MQAEYVNPFVMALSNTFKTMLDCDVRRGVPYLRGSDMRSPSKDICGVIGMSGKMVGMCIVGLSKSVALNAASHLLMIPCHEINTDVTDAVGEIANMVAGAAKAQLEEHELRISLPSVIVGENYQVRFPSMSPPICIPFQCEWGEILLEVGLVPCEAPVGA